MCRGLLWLGRLLLAHRAVNLPCTAPCTLLPRQPCACTPTHCTRPPKHQPQVTEKLEPLAEKLEVPEKVKVNA